MEIIRRSKADCQVSCGEKATELAVSCPLIMMGSKVALMINRG